MSSEKRFGVLGGMGPESTLHFYNYILKTTGAKTDQENLESVIAMLPKIPDRTSAILNQGKDPSPEILAGLQLLAQMGAEFAVVTCNTAHYFIRKMEKLPLPIIDLISVATHEVGQRGAQAVGLLATSGTIRSGIYENSLNQLGVRVVKPDKEIQEKVMSIIYGNQGVKAGRLSRENMNKLEECVFYLLEQGAEVIILGCTELSMLVPFEELSSSDTLIDPLLVLAKETVKKAKGGEYEQA